MRRRSPSSARSSAPSVVPSARCHDHGSRASSAIAPTPSHAGQWRGPSRSEEHTSELQSLMRISFAVFCLKKKKQKQKQAKTNESKNDRQNRTQVQISKKQQPTTLIRLTKTLTNNT